MHKTTLLAWSAILSALADSNLTANTLPQGFDDLPVVLSATRLSQPLRDVPAAITIIDHKTIVASGARSIPDVLRLVPGVQVARVDGSRTTVTYHGLSDRFAHNMQVLIDGRSIYEAAHGLVAWQDLPIDIDDVARIEVIRGPNAATYGANAYSATINIITFHPAEQGKFYGRLSQGSNNSQTTVFRGTASGEDSHHRVTVKYETTEGLASRYDDAQTNMFSYRGDAQLNDRDTLLLQLGHSQGPRQDGFGDPTDLSQVPFIYSPGFVAYQPEHQVHDTHHTAQLKWSRRFGSEEEINLQFYYNHQTIDDDFHTVTFGQFFGASDIPQLALAFPGQTDQPFYMGYGKQSDRYDLEFAHTLSPGEKWRLSWGAGARLDSARSFVMFGSQERQNIKQLRLFANSEWRATDALVINAGAMVEKYENFSTQLSPRLAANMHVDNQNTFRLSVTDAYRMPTLIENHSNQASYFQDGTVFDYIDYGPGNLEPEKMRSYEAGYIFQSPETGLNLDIKAYKSRLDNMIEIPKDHACAELSIPGADPAVCDILNDLMYGRYSGRFTYDNNGYADVEGIELGSHWNFTEDTWLRGAYGFARMEHHFLVSLNSQDENNNYQLLPEPVTTVHTNHIPRNTWSALLVHHFSLGIYGSLTYYKIDGMKWLEDGDVLPGYHRTDARLAKHFQYGRESGSIALIAQNINNRYFDFQFENIVEQSLFLELTLEVY